MPLVANMTSHAPIATDQKVGVRVPPSAPHFPQVDTLITLWSARFQG
jgi:hypothetical protein